MSASRITRIAPVSPATRITRIAPTPSGFLHLGNAVNFAVISQLSSAWGSQVALRIDDMDSGRSRTEYIDDIFETLTWLEVPWSIGPRDQVDFERGFTMAKRTDYYRAQLDQLRDSGLEVFACSCSRADLAESGGMRCAGACAESALTLEVGRTALRLRIPEGLSVSMAGSMVDLDAIHGDVVLWRRDGLPSYHLVTVIEDRDLGVTDIVRGADLRDSSALHAWLAPYLDAENVARANYVHHDLVVDRGGVKLSKSQLDTGPLERSDEQRDRVREIARGIVESLGY